MHLYFQGWGSSRSLSQEGAFSFLSDKGRGELSKHPCCNKSGIWSLAQLFWTKGYIGTEFRVENQLAICLRDHLIEGALSLQDILRWNEEMIEYKQLIAKKAEWAEVCTTMPKHMEKQLWTNPWILLQAKFCQTHKYESREFGGEKGEICYETRRKNNSPRATAIAVVAQKH